MLLTVVRVLCTVDDDGFISVTKTGSEAGELGLFAAKSLLEDTRVQFLFVAVAQKAEHDISVASKARIYT